MVGIQLPHSSVSTVPLRNRTLKDLHHYMSDTAATMFSTALACPNNTCRPNELNQKLSYYKVIHKHKGIFASYLWTVLSFVCHKKSKVKHLLRKIMESQFQTFQSYKHTKKLKTRYFQVASTMKDSKCVDGGWLFLHNTPADATCCWNKTARTC